MFTLYTITIFNKFIFSIFCVSENPVLSEEYLQTRNADIIAGPIELSSCMDLNEQGGMVTLTSPKLFKTKSRNFLIHIKTMTDVSKDGQGKTRGNYLYFSFSKMFLKLVLLLLLFILLLLLTCTIKHVCR